MPTHFDEETLFVYLENVESGEGKNVDIETHLATCRDCNELFVSVHEFLGALGDREVWADEEISLPRAPIDGRRVEVVVEAARRATEGAAEGERLLTTLLAAPLETWRTRCAATPALRTPATTQLLLQRSQQAREKNPAEALELARVAIDLSSTFGASDADTRLKGLAWKEAANAFRYLSRYDEALDAVDRATNCFRKMLVSEYDLGATEYVRGQVMRELGRLSEALAHARRSRELAVLFGDTRRVALAAILEGSCHASSGDWAGARDAYFSVLKPMQQQGDMEMVAALFSNLGACSNELGDRDAASTYFLQAMLAYEDLGMPVAVNRIRWNLGRMLLASPRLDDAISRLEQCRTAFEQLGMTSEVGLISLDLAEGFLLAGRASKVPSLCREAIVFFERVGITKSARIALAYLDEAIRVNRATPKIVHYVREYIEQLPQKENLLFAPPAD